jgi:hypothetical protein
LQISQFYVNTKKGEAQKKTFDIKVFGFDVSGKKFSLGQYQFDMAPFCSRQDCDMEIPLDKSKFPGTVLKFNMTIAEPNKIDKELVFGSALNLMDEADMEDNMDEIETKNPTNTQAKDEDDDAMIYSTEQEIA